MHTLKLLNNIQDLIFLRDLYQRHPETSRHGFHTLSNFIRWYELDPDLDFVRVYVINNTWREKGFFIIEDDISNNSFSLSKQHIRLPRKDQYQLFINCVIYDEKEVETALKSWNWERRYKITALPAILLDIVQKTLQELSVQYKMGTLGIYQRDNKDISRNEIECPDAFEIRQLSVSDAVTINNLWYSRQEGSLDFLESLIKYNISLGIFCKNSDELIAWCTRCPCGFMSTLHVREQHRRHGLASLLINEFSRRIAMEGHDVRVMINEMNRMSINLFTKFQFRFDEKVFILFCEPSNLTFS